MSGGRAFWIEGTAGANVLRRDCVLEVARRHVCWSGVSNRKRREGSVQREQGLADHCKDFGLFSE